MKRTSRKELISETEMLRRSNAELGKELVYARTELAKAVAANAALTAKITNVYSVLCTMVTMMKDSLQGLCDDSECGEESL